MRSAHCRLQSGAPEQWEDPEGGPTLTPAFAVTLPPEPAQLGPPDSPGENRTQARGQGGGCKQESAGDSPGSWGTTRRPQDTWLGLGSLNILGSQSPL